MAVWHDSHISQPQSFIVKLRPKIVGLYASIHGRYCTVHACVAVYRSVALVITHSCDVVIQMLHWTVSNGRLLSSDNMLAIVNCFSSVLCNSQLVTLLSDRQSVSFVCSAAAAVHAFVCSCECCNSLYIIISSSTVCPEKKETKMFL